MAKHLEASKRVKDFWKKASDIVDACGDLAGAQKLYNNMRDPATKSQVAHVVDQYYGDIDVLWNTIQERRAIAKSKVEKYNLACTANDLLKIKSPDTIIDLLYEDDRRVYYRRHINSYLKKNEIVPLQRIEMAYRQLLEKRKKSKKPKKG